MTSNYYAVKLIPPRPDFAMTMSSEEQAIMQKHAAYWQQHMEKGKVAAFGPVLDPKGVYGFGIVSADSEEELKQFIDNDPSLQINTVEYYPMMAMVK
jgi:uncharacterized protein YciI